MIEVEYAYKRADGCSGSAIKGIQALLIPAPRKASSSAYLPSNPCFSAECDESAIHGGSGWHHKWNRQDLHRIIIASVGYDQRLSLWSPLPFCSTLAATVAYVPLDVASDKNEVFLVENDDDEDTEVALFSNVADITHSRDELLEWVAGSAIHIGDVCAFDACPVSTTLSSHCSAYDSKAGDGMTAPLDANRKEFLDSEIAMIVVGEGFQLLTATI